MGDTPEDIVHWQPFGDAVRELMDKFSLSEDEAIAAVKASREVRPA